MALVNPNIAMSYRGVEVPQQNALADYAAVQQIQSGQRQAEVAQMQIEQMRRDDATLKQIQAKSMEHGGPTDLDSIADAYLKSGNPKFVEFGVGLRQKLDEKKQFASIMGSAPRAAAAAPASEAYPGYNEAIGMRAPAPAAAPVSEPYPGYNQAIGMTPSVNAMAPAAAPAANALADVAMLRQRRDAFLSLGTPQAIAAARALDSDIALASKPPVRQVVSAGSTVLGPDGKVIFTAPAAPAAPTDIAKLIKERDLLPKGSPDRALYDQEIADRRATAENARQRLAFDQAKFNWEKNNPGFEIREADDGSVVGVNKRTLQAFPVTVGGAAPAAGGAGMPSARVPAAATQAPVAGGTPLRGKGQGMTEGERKASTLLQRLQFSENQLTKALVDDPNAAKPGVFTSALDVLSTPLANKLTPEARQRVQSAQLDILDAALTLGTGAAYTKEQLEGYRSSYFPAIGDGPTQVKDKKARLQNVISAAKIAAGKGAKLIPDTSSGANANDPLGLLGGK